MSTLRNFKIPHFHWWVMTLIFVVYTVEYADRANIGFALPLMQKEFNLDNTQGGLLVSLFFAGYAIMQIPAGFLIKKFGVRQIYTLGILTTAICTGLMGLADSIAHLNILRFLVGVSEAAVVIGSTVTINNWFPEREKGTATGIFLASSNMGPLVVPLISAWILMNFDWRYIFIFFSIPGVVLALLWIVMINNNPEKSRFVSRQELDYIRSGVSAKKIKKVREYKAAWLDKVIRARHTELLTSSRQCFRCWDIYGAALGYFFMVGTVGVLMSWLPKYLLQEQGFSMINSAYLAAAPFVGTLCGNLFGGWVSDNLLGKRRKPMMMVSAITTIVSMLLIVNAPTTQLILTVLFFTTGLFLGLGYSAFSVYAMGRVDKKTYPIAYGIINMGGQLGGMCMPFIVGMILDHYNWSMVFLTLSVAAVLCLLFVCSITEPLSDGQKRAIDRPLATGHEVTH
ncbi:MFS transporter [Brenneria roseae]|uniref:MFS transporter n=1 Tax=Brenneria roseae TaxID=1509241 RepID=UPI001FFB2A05|nr:MFS transporter [Brenneria roseae]